MATQKGISLGKVVGEAILAQFADSVATDHGTSTSHRCVPGFARKTTRGTLGNTRSIVGNCLSGCIAPPDDLF